SIVYAYMINNFTFSDYLIGIGPYTWENYFTENIGVRIQDPHSFIFSVPGGYGVLGVALYLSLGWVITFKGFLSRNEKARIAAVGLLVITFIKDISTIPTPLGTTHFTFLYWLLFTMMLYYANSAQKSAPDISGNNDIIRDE